MNLPRNSHMPVLLEITFNLKMVGNVHILDLDFNIHILDLDLSQDVISFPFLLLFQDIFQSKHLCKPTKHSPLGHYFLCLSL